MSLMVQLARFALLLVGLLYASSTTDVQVPRGIKTGVEKSPRPAYAGSFALLIGVDYRSSSWPLLPSIPKELATLRSVLIQHGFEVTEPSPREMTAAGLRQAVWKFIGEHALKPENRVLIFFSGHGQTREYVYGEKGYFVPRDAPQVTENLERFASTAIEMGEVQTWARSIESKHAIFMFDSCFSGSIFRTRGLPVPKYLVNSLTLPVRQFFTAGSANETVPSESTFLPLVVRGLRGEADADCDAFITATELHTWVSKRIAAYNIRQTPQLGKIQDTRLDQGEFLFPLSSLPQHCSTPAATLTDVTATLEEDFWNVIVDRSDVALLRRYLDRVREGAFPGKYVDSAETKLRDLERPERTTRSLRSADANQRFFLNLTRLLAVSVSPETGLDVDLSLLHYGTRPDGAPLPDSYLRGDRLEPGNYIGFRIFNRGARRIEASLLFVDASGATQLLSPMFHILSAGETRQIGPFELGDAPVGLQQVYLIASGSPIAGNRPVIPPVNVVGGPRWDPKDPNGYVVRVLSWVTSKGAGR